MPTYPQLMESFPGCLNEAGTGLEAAAGELTALTDLFASTVRAAETAWTGDAKQAHTGAAGTLRDAITGVGANFREVGSLAQEAGETLGALVTTLRETSTAAEAMGFEVIPAAEAQVIIGPAQEAQAAAAGPFSEAVIAAYEAIAEVYTAFLAALVAAATAADEAFAAGVEGIGGQLDAAAAGMVKPPATDPVFSSDLQPGNVRLDGLMSFTHPDESRGTGGEAYLTSDMMRTGAKPSVPADIVPAGYLGGAGPHAKSHVIADVLGGPLDDPANYATLYSRAFSRVNDGPMAKLEKRVKSVVSGNTPGIPQQNVRYRVDMTGADRLPNGVRIHLIGDRGYRESVYLPNM